MTGAERQINAGDSSTPDGAILVDKPEGMSSAAVVGAIKRRFRLNKAGHAGTLDPMATGLLVVLCGRATRLQDVVMGAHKGYAGTIRLGIATATDDVTGEITERDEALERRTDIDQALVDRMRSAFSGRQMQRPPQVSALHVSGRRSYQLVRQGKLVELEEREVLIEFQALELTAPDRLQYRVQCSKGTYIRSLARDIGRALGTCAALESIRRTHSAPFSVDDAAPLEQILDEPIERRLISPLRLVEHLPAADIDGADCRLIRAGNQLPLRRLTLPPLDSGGLAALRSAETKQLVALLESSGEQQGNWRLRVVF